MERPAMPNLNDDDNSLSCDIFPITTGAQLESAAGILMHFAQDMDATHAHNLIREVIMNVDIYGENIRKIKWNLPLALCRNLDEIDVNFSISYVIYERQKLQADKAYGLFTDAFFNDSPQRVGYGSVDDPIQLPSISFTYNYLDKLAQKYNNQIEYKRVGSMPISGKELIMDRYRIKNIESKECAEVIVNPYSKLYYTALPKLQW